MNIAEHWLCIPEIFKSGIDAALMGNNHKIYFFKGTQYIRYTAISAGIDDGYPMYINNNWMPFPE